MAVKLTPPPPTKDSALDRWLNLIHRLLTGTGQIDASQIGTIDHGTTAGLADDDHTQYAITSSGSRLQTAISSPSNGWVLTYNSTSGKWEAQAATGGVTDHGALTGLTDDDHTQYVRADGTRGVSANTASDAILFENAGSGKAFYSSTDTGAAIAEFRALSVTQSKIFVKCNGGYQSDVRVVNDGSMFVCNDSGAGILAQGGSKGSMPTFWFGRFSPVTKTSSFTVGDAENWLICNGAGAITVTMPSASGPNAGREIMIKTVAAQAVNSASSNVIPLAGGAAGTAILAATAGKWATLVSNGTNWEIMQAG